MVEAKPSVIAQPKAGLTLVAALYET